MKKTLLLLGALSSIHLFGQTGSAADFQKISSQSGGLQSELIDEGRFGYISESQTPNIVFSGAPFNANGEFFILELNDEGSVTSETRVSAADLSYFDGLIGAEFGSAVVDLGDQNGDDQIDLIVGAPGLDGGKFFLLISSSQGYQLTELEVPVDVRNISERLGEFMAYHNGNLYAASSHAEGVVYRFQIGANALTVLETFGVENPMLAGKLEEGDRFGSGLSLADVNNDGIADLLCGAPGDDDQDTNFGAVYMLYLNAFGDLAEVQKISRLEGDFGGFLNVDDEFGISVRAIGDLDQNGVVDLAVGAPGDDDGGTNIGSVWILFRHPDGWVINERKINRFEGNFTLELGTEDRLADRIALVGDLNDDGTMDIVASVPGDDDGGNDRGGFFTIFLEYCPAPSGDFDFEVEGPTVQFSAEGGEGYSYIWNFDDGGFSEQQNPTHTYQSAGTYMVCLAINNECGGDNFCENVQVTSVLNTEEILSSHVSLYPNPANDQIFVSGYDSEASIRIIDITGKEVKSERLNREGIEVSELNEGIYLMEISNRETRVIKKFKVVR